MALHGVCDANPSETQEEGEEEGVADHVVRRPNTAAYGGGYQLALFSTLTHNSSIAQLTHSYTTHTNPGHFKRAIANVSILRIKGQTVESVDTPLRNETYKVMDVLK